MARKRVVISIEEYRRRAEDWLKLDRWILSETRKPKYRHDNYRR